MTEEQKANYFEGGATRCPYCNHDELDCDRLMLAEFEDEYECRTRCLRCKKEWTDVYRVVDVRHHEDEDGYEDDEDDHG